MFCEFVLYVCINFFFCYSIVVCLYFIFRISVAGFHHSVCAVDDGRHLRKLHEFPPHSSRILYWLAPEVLRQNVNGYNTKSDVYSIGIAACELANGEIPFENMATTQVLVTVK